MASSPILDIECLITGCRRQHGPLHHVRVQHCRARTELLVPSNVITRKCQRLLEMCCHGGVDNKPDQVVQLVVPHCPDDVRWSKDVPAYALFSGIPEQDIFLGIVEVAFNLNTRICLKRRCVSRSDMESVRLNHNDQQALGRPLVGGTAPLPQSAARSGVV